MSTSNLNLLNVLFSTSNIQLPIIKASQLVDNKIAILDIQDIKQKKIYNYITQILLLLISVCTIYQPLNDGIDWTGAPSITLLALFLIGSILIYRKEK